MNTLIQRKFTEKVEKYLQIFPIVTILGSRQCGKSTLVKMLSSTHSEILYVDLQDRQDIQKLGDPAFFFETNQDKIICLDEIQLLPDLFSYLRSEVDRLRRPGRFILLGSASGQLLQHTSETLAGRVGFIDMTPFLALEICHEPDYSLDRYWLRGGYPDSYLAPDDETSSIWREQFLRTYVERDIPQLGFAIAAPKWMRLLSMLAHEHGGILNASNIANAMGLSAPTIRHYIDILEETYTVRILPPYFANIKKRLTKSPRLYFRDTGLLHQILQIKSFNNLMGHPVFGHSWEGLVLENIAMTVPQAQISYYRTATGNEEMDIVIEFPDRLIAVECKAAKSPQLSEGFWKAVDTLKPAETFVVCPVDEPVALREHVTLIGLEHLLLRLG